MTQPASSDSRRPDIFAGFPDDKLFTPAEVAKLLRVNPKTVTRWANAGRLDSVRTLGGHRRFFVQELRRILAEQEG